LTGNHYHQYIQPQRPIEQEAIDVHGITNEFLADKPVFAQIAADFIDFIKGAELVIHNAPFDIGFMDHEFAKLNRTIEPTKKMCSVVDTLVLAKKLHPGQKNNLDALCRRYGIDNSHRTLHGALLDAEILADVYLFMTGGQTRLDLSQDSMSADGNGQSLRRITTDRKPLKIIYASADDIEQHEKRLDIISDSGSEVIWRQ
jgi:DNA polymerase-3 subunit epsilon